MDDIQKPEKLQERLNERISANKNPDSLLGLLNFPVVKIKTVLLTNVEEKVNGYQNAQA